MPFFANTKIGQSFRKAKIRPDFFWDYFPPEVTRSCSEPEIGRKRRETAPQEESGAVRRGPRERFFARRGTKNCSVGKYFVSFDSQTSIAMKKVLLIVLFVTGIACGAAAQNIVLGERVPELKAAAWLNDREPVPAPMTYIEFFHSTNPSCLHSVKRLNELTTRMNGRICVIVVTKEDPEKVAQLIGAYQNKRFFIALRADKGFELFGVAYVPSGVLVDPRNRALWMGNSLQFTEKTIEQSTR